MSPVPAEYNAGTRINKTTIQQYNNTTPVVQTYRTLHGSSTGTGARQQDTTWGANSAQSNKGKGITPVCGSSNSSGLYRESPAVRTKCEYSIFYF